MPASLFIPARFNGPPASGNGGYSCGILAACIDGVARVRLHVPPPLDRQLQLSRGDKGAALMHDGETLVASAVPAQLELDVPPAPTLGAAEAAESGFPCFDDHTFPTCFVCGPGRPDHDGLELFPGPVTDWSLLACCWRPTPDLLDEQGMVRPEIVWSALDCPGYFAASGQQHRPALLGELVAELKAPVPGKEALVVFAWPLGVDGRKLYAGTAVASAAGQILAVARSTWITLPC